MVLTDRRTFDDLLAFSQPSVGDRSSATDQRSVSYWSGIGRRLMEDWSVTGWRLFYRQFLRKKMFGKNITISMQVATLIIY